MIGGGAGGFVVLSGIKKYALDISAIVCMTDSGGSTGRLRDQYGVLPPGDLRQCLVALSRAPELWSRLFLYRFESGDLEGHNFGNLFLTALEKITDNYQEVVDTAAYILDAKGKVMPVTLDKVHLCVEYEDGEVIETESLIDTAFHKTSRIVKAYLKPTAHANPESIKAIQEADLIIVGPGDLYTSLIPNFVVEGVKEAIAKSHAPIVNIMNLMTKRGQTTNYKASDHIRDLEAYLGRSIDLVLVNNKKISPKILAFYTEYNEIEVVDDLSEKSMRLDLLANKLHVLNKADSAMRSLVRHDPEKVGAALIDIIKKTPKNGKNT